MTRKELKELLKDNKPNEKHHISSSDFLNIGLFTSIVLKMDNKTYDYYYEIDVDELLASKLPNEEYETMKDQGWSFMGNKLLIYLN